MFSSLDGVSFSLVYGRVGFPLLVPLYSPLLSSADRSNGRELRRVSMHRQHENKKPKRKERHKARQGRGKEGRGGRQRRAGTKRDIIFGAVLQALV